MALDGIFPLSFFPEGSLSSSVITTVWVGIWVVCYFNLRLGWVFSGLVIPGYLVPLILVRPFSAGVIVGEALMTYGLVWTFSEASPKLRKWPSLFGRDRFFALVLTSIAVRLLSEAWAVPILTDWMQQYVEGVSVLESDLSGYGLIVTSLIANQLWKPGLKKGIVPFFVCTLLTWAIVRWGLMEATNFSISNLAFMYEDIAASLEAAPKAYIVLIVASFIASRLNLKYGWEFNGILIPSLLALQWYQPMKIVTTFTECFFIYALASLALRLPVIRDINMEGARKFLLFFNVGFFYKIALGHGLAILIPSFKSSDAFGYGYMLSTLLAVKMHDKGIFLKMSRATLQASFQSVVWASLLGYGLNLAVQWMYPTKELEQQNLERSTHQHTLGSWMREHKLSLQRLREPDSIPTPGPQEQESFARLIRHLLAHQDIASSLEDPEVLQLARRSPYRLRWIEEEETLALIEKEPAKGWGSYLLRPSKTRSINLQVPAPLTEWCTVEAATSLFRHLDGRSLALAGASRTVNRDGSSDMLTSRESLYSIFGRLCGTQGSLQIRGLGEAYLKKEKGVRNNLGKDISDERSELLVYGALPIGLDLKKVSKVIPSPLLLWDHTEGSKLPREVSPRSQGELFLSRADRRRLLYLQTARDKWNDQEGPQMISGFLTDRLLDESRGILSKGSGTYQEPALEEMLYFDEEVLTPLINTVRTLSKNMASTDWEAAMRSIHASARPLGYSLTLYRHEISKERYFILSEEGEIRRGWGTLVMRLGPSTPYVLQVPRPLSEPKTLEAATRLFQRRRCEALLVSGAHALTNQDRSSDPLYRGVNHPISLFQQVLLRETPNEGRTMIQFRGLSGGRNPSNPTTIMASHHGWIDKNQVDVRAKAWMDGLEEDGIPVALWNGDPFELGGNPWNVPQARYIRATQAHDFWQLWLPPEIRAFFRRRDLMSFTAKTFRSVGIPTVETYVLGNLSNRERVMIPLPRLQTQMTAINAFLDRGQILYLWELLRDHPNLNIEHWVDLDTKSAFLVSLNSKGDLIWMVRLGSLLDDSKGLPQKDDITGTMDVLSGVGRWYLPKGVDP